jgi:hypothetical protein
MAKKMENNLLKNGYVKSGNMVRKANNLPTPEKKVLLEDIIKDIKESSQEVDLRILNRLDDFYESINEIEINQSILLNSRLFKILRFFRLV